MLRGTKDSPSHLHDGRLLTLDDTVKFFNVVLGTQLSAEAKADLVAFMLRPAVPREGIPEGSERIP